MNIRASKVRAISSTVSNMERSLNFYTKALSFKLVDDITIDEDYYCQLEAIPPTKIRIATLSMGNELIELKEYLDLEGKPIPSDTQGNDLWFHHFAIVVKDMERAYEQLSQFSFEKTSIAPQTLDSGIKAFKFKDPDGHNLELIYFPSGIGQDKWQKETEELFLGIDHTAISVTNTEDNLKFYRDLLSLEVTAETVNVGQIQANLDGLDESKVQITSLFPVGEDLGVEFLDYIIPPTGRAFDASAKSYDLTHMQIQIVVNEIEKIVSDLKQNEVEIVSPQIIDFPDSYPYSKGCLIKDPNGHGVLIIS